MQEQVSGSTVEFPVMIVGAGPVGLTLAASLAKHGIRSIRKCCEIGIEDEKRPTRH